MNLLDVYCAWQRKEITDHDLAHALGMADRDLKFRLTKWGYRLPTLLSTLDQIRANAITREQAATLLNVTPRQVNYLMQSWNVERPIPQYLITNATADVKWEIRKKYAIEYIANSCAIDEAAENAEVSSRQMRRWVSDLLHQHFGMMFKDLRSLPLHKRERLAHEVELAEGLELAKQNVIRAISTGKQDIRSEAIDRVINQRGRNVRRISKTRPKPQQPS